ncbi:hypothetical protein FRC20_006546 [Serendipita sp. 405]|nr:hypothetical protein FRC20_006546 [Serendipita sp. 405]
MSAIPLHNDLLGQPLVVRNKRGRKVDETLPKSHQREVQRLFRARRSTHLSDLERRVSLLERENVILRQWAGVKPSDRYLLGRGPTGCDTTKPLIADENDAEIQLEMDDSLPHERTWPRTPPALPPAPPRASFVLDQQPPQQPPTPRSEVPGSTSMGTGIINHNIHPNVLQPSGGVSYDKPPQPSYQMTNAQKYKPHPLYDHLEPLPPPPAPISYEPPPPSSSYGHDRLIKRESVYPNSGASMIGSSQDLSSAQSHSAHSAPYYSIPHRPSYSRPMDPYNPQPVTAIPADSPTSHMPLYAQSSWPDSYAPRPPTTPVPRRPQVTATLASIVPPVGLSSGPLSSSSPQTTSSNSGSESRSNISPDGAYDQRRSSVYSAYPPPSATPAPMPPTSVYIPHSQPPSQSQTTPTSAVSMYGMDNSSHRDLSAPQPPSHSDSFR